MNRLTAGASIQLHPQTSLAKEIPASRLILCDTNRTRPDRQDRPDRFNLAAASRLARLGRNR
jgi:hypothetical protein